MLRITIELFPHGKVSAGHILSQSFIVNDSTGTAEDGSYYVTESTGKIPVQLIPKYKRSKGHRLLAAKALQLLDKESLK